ncbi:MAG: NADPH:quinone reductase [Planctomycetales bacterium]|nr:NADPH:quinone reductase [Planctomycetales bacterium]
MRAAFIHTPGPVENIEVGDLPAPIPGPQQALVRVRAASLNPIDTYVRSGLVAMELPQPFILGCDLAGEVVEVGAEVHDLQPGDRVWGSNQGLLGRQGTFAEYAAVDRQWLYPVPPSISFETAAATALVGLTAQMGLEEYAQLQAGETLLVSGASGAVGSTVLQIAKARGARVIAVTGGAEKVEYCRSLGADEAIDYCHHNVAQELAKIASDGVEAWWETSRSPSLETAIHALKRHGRLILMAGRDARPEFPIGPFYVKCLKAMGFVMFLESPETQRRAAMEVNRLLESGQLKTHIDRIATLDATAELHHLQHEHTVLCERPLTGKIVVTP